MVEQHTLQGTDLKYILGQDRVLFSNGVLVGRDVFDNTAASSLAETVCNGNSLYDYKYAVTTGTLRKKRLVKAPKETSEHPSSENIVSENITTTVMIFIGLGSAAMSAYHSFMYLKESKPVLVSLLIAVMLILFSSISFTASRYCFKLKTSVKFCGVVFALLGCAVVIFSMFNTVAVSYAQYSTAEEKQVVSLKKEIKQNTDELLRLNSVRKQQLQENLKTLNEEAQYWKDKSWRRYDEIQKKIEKADFELSDILKEEKGTAKEDTKAQKSVEEMSVFSFLERVLKIKAVTIKFIVYVIPAVFFDAAAPFALSIVLVFIDRRRKWN